MKRLFWNFIAIFCLLFILSFEFEYSIVPSFYNWVNPFFESLVSFSGEYFYSLNNGFNSTISSDSLGLYIHTFNLIIGCFIITALIEFLFKEKRVNLRLYILKILPYYLSLQLLIYGFDKVFKAQFFLPEPNTLFTPLKDISKDLLYWSTIGVSRSYSVFLGLAEVVTAIFLLFRKTRLIAIVLGIGIMTNVVAVNFSYDISVKVYSLFLLLGFFVLASPYFGFFYQVFIQKKPVIFPLENEVIFANKSMLQKGLKWVIILLFFAEKLFPFVTTQNFNDDVFPRPKFHGAYEIIESETEIENLFVHRKGYLIFKNEKDEFQDFQLEIDSVNNKLLLFNYETKRSYNLDYLEENNKLTQLKGTINGTEIDLSLEHLNIDSIQLFQNSFHWTTQ